MEAYSRDEANALLVEIRPIVERLVRAQARLDEALERREGLTRIVGSNGHARAEAPAEATAAVEDASREVIRNIEAITSLGGMVKDARQGLVDFPGLVDGELVWLCWRLGEPAVDHYHAIDEGFSGRRPLPD